uniref:Uncharacterized protein n=1 Tax=Anopheles atroparvus TaxID=41427 RepID=A0AAG5DMW8_ANOAO
MIFHGPIWPLIMQFFRSKAAYNTLPVRRVVVTDSFNGSYHCIIADSIQEKLEERITDENILKDATIVDNLAYEENVSNGTFHRRASPSASRK